MSKNLFPNFKIENVLKHKDTLFPPAMLDAFNLEWFPYKQISVQIYTLCCGEVGITTVQLHFWSFPLRIFSVNMTKSEPQEKEPRHFDKLL